MKKRTLTVLVVALVCTFLTACSKEIDTMTESVNEKESSVIENPTVLEDTTEIVFPEQFEALSGYDEEALVEREILFAGVPWHIFWNTILTT